VRRLAPLALLLAACDGLKVPAPRQPSGAAVSVEPAGDLSAAPAVLRLRVADAAGHEKLSDFRIFSGRLSSYYLNRLAARDEPDTLLAKEVPALVWVEADDVVVAPTRALDAGTYTLATPARGAVAEVTVASELVPWLARRWPPRDETSGSGLAVFCGDAAPAVGAGPVVLAPAAVDAELCAWLGPEALFAEQCVSLEPSPSGAGAPELPPALAGGAALEPLPLFAADTPLAAATCADGAVALGPACALVDDDRVTLSAPAEPSLWALQEPERLLAVAAPGASIVVHGFEPGVAVRMRAVAFDRSGARTSVDVAITGAARRPHVVINEVLANPRGAEAESEWIELVNDGAAAVELDGFELRDDGGTVLLPSARLEPNELVLLAARGFAPDPELDVPAARGTRILTLPKLAASGLSNAGELLRLSDASGLVLSRFPALASTEPGVSIARRTPDAPDGEAASFGPHAAPGASPGAPNELAAP
jgi:hypothetical protein